MRIEARESSSPLAPCLSLLISRPSLLVPEKEWKTKKNAASSHVFLSIYVPVFI